MYYLALRKITCLLLLCLFIKSNLNASLKIDSLKQNIENLNRDSTKVDALLEIAEEIGIQNINESLVLVEEALEISQLVGYKTGIGKAQLIYANLIMEQGKFIESIEHIKVAEEVFKELDEKRMLIRCEIAYGKIADFNGEYQKAITIYKNALVKSKQTGSIDEVALLNMYLGVILEQIGDYDKALEYYTKSLELSKQQKNKKQVARSHNNLGVAYYYLGDYLRALDHYQESLKISEELGMDAQIAYCYNNIGIIHELLSDDIKAIEYYKKSLIIHEQSGSIRGVAGCYNNIGDVKKGRQEYDSALLYYIKALNIFEESADKRNMAFSYNIIGNLYNSQDLLKEAEENYYKSLKLAESIADSSGIAWIMQGLAGVHNKKGDYFGAIKLGEQALKFAKTENELELLKNTYGILQMAYSSTRNFKRAYENLELFKKYSDSLLNENNIQEVAEKEFQYNYEKDKQVLKLEQHKRELEYHKEIQAQKILQNSFLIALVFVALMAINFYYNSRRKKKANKQLVEQKGEILEKNEELNQLNHEINAQKDEILKIHTNVTDSIKYAKRIQTALLPQKSLLDNILGQYFIIYRPLEIVSGDFFWVKQKGSKMHLAVADCTGHGVPGAFMSVLGMAYLNEIFRANANLKANGILNELRSEIKQSLGQKGVEFETNDGMDISFLSIDRSSLVAQFAGGYSNLYLVRNGEIHVYKGDKQPIAIYDEEKPFTNFEIQLQENDLIYMFTDGYVDQFGGEKGRKFLIKNFRKLLVEASGLSIDKQKSVIENELVKWMKGYPQVDDILVVGIKI